jgi:sugar lactone lactonase YvrE
MRELEQLHDGGTFFEGLRWHDGHWWVSDFYDEGGKVLQLAEDGTAVQEILVDHPSGLGWLPDGDLLVVSRTRHEVLRVGDDGVPRPYADLSEFSVGEANDMTVDEAGRAYVGSFGYDLYAGEQARGATLMRVDPDGTVSAAAADLHFPNAVMLPPGEDTLIIAETIAARITAFDKAPDGTLSNRRVYAQIAPTPALEEIDAEYTKVGYGPDGCTLDAEGHLWCGDSLGRRVARIAPGGEIVEEIASPLEDYMMVAAALGGSDGRTLLAAASPDWRLGMGSGEPLASLWTTRVDVPHSGGRP